MGILTRLFVPRKVRRAAHPVRRAKRRVTPRSVRRTRRRVFVVRHPARSAKGKAQNAIVGLFRPRRRRRGRRRRRR